MRENIETMVQTIGSSLKVSIKTAVGAVSQCYYDELILLMCELMLLKSRSTQIIIKMDF